MHVKQGGGHTEAQEWCWHSPHGHESPESRKSWVQVLVLACSSCAPWAGSLPSLGSSFPIHKGQLHLLPWRGGLGGVLSYEGTPRCPPRPGQLAARTAVGLAPEYTGCGYEAGGAHDLFSPPGPHSALMPGLVLNPPAAPMCPAGRAPRLARRPQTAGTSHRSPSQRTPPLRAPQRCQRPRTGTLGLRAHRAGAWEWWAHFFHPHLGWEAWVLSQVLL